MDIEGVANGIIRDSCTKLRDLFVSPIFFFSELCSMESFGSI